MRKKGFKGRTEKRVVGKCKGVFRAYDEIQSGYADMLQADDGIIEIRCNVLLDGLDEGEYTSDFVCIKTDGDIGIFRIHRYLSPFFCLTIMHFYIWTLMEGSAPTATAGKSG